MMLLNWRREGGPMQKIKSGLKLAAVLLCIFSLTACEKSEINEPEDEYSVCQMGFTYMSGNPMIESPDGYYVFNGNFLNFYDKSLENPIVVCSRPECMHENEPEDKRTECNAFFGSQTDLKYYNGSLYIGASALKGDEACSIYKVSLDGSEREKIYTGAQGGGLQFVIYKGDIIVFEKQYKEDEVKAVLTRFPIRNPEEPNIIFESHDLEDPYINRLEYDGDFLYFELSDYSENIENFNYRIDLKTNEALLFCDEMDNGFEIGSDRVIATKNIESNSENWTWVNEIYQYSKDGKKEKKLTEEDYPALGRGASVQGVDGQYIYMADINYGANALPEEERYIYVYTYDGEEAARVLQPGGTFEYIFPGSDDYMIVEGNDGESSAIYYKVDKSEFGSGRVLEAEEFLRVDPSNTDYSYSY